MNDLRNMLLAAATTAATLSTTMPNNTFRGLEGHAICHVQTNQVDSTAIKSEKSPKSRFPDGGAQVRLAVSVAESENATCQLCHLGHKTHHSKDLGKVLTFSTGGHPASQLELHHLCGTLALRGDKAVFTIEELRDALEEAKIRRCHACNSPGAFIQCCYGECNRWYHLGCSMNATDVVVDVSVGQLYCPKHTVPDSDDSNGADEIIRTTPKKQRNGCGLKAVSGPKRKPVSVQRPRTDWQRRGVDTWVKVVPPWWAEQKTVHFANKVFRELFQSNLEVDVVDEHGTLWKCEVTKEMRNDMRLQFTLTGQFQDLWVHAGIVPGDVLTFEKVTAEASNDLSTEECPVPHVIRMTRHAQGVGFEDLTAPRAKKARTSSTSNMKESGGMTTGSGAAHGQPTRSTKSRHTSRTTQAPPRTQGKIVTQETPWSFVSDRVARKVMHPNNVAKVRCPMTEELVAKIAVGSSVMTVAEDKKIGVTFNGTSITPALDHLSGVTDGGTGQAGHGSAPTSTTLGPTFAVFDPALRRHFVFEAEINESNATRYITGGGFMAWMVEAAVKPEDSIQLEFTHGLTGGQMILVSKIPCSGTPENTNGLSRAPSSDCSTNSSMKTLAAAACYCHTHGTPGIKALLDLPSSDREILEAAG